MNKKIEILNLWAVHNIFIITQTIRVIKRTEIEIVEILEMAETIYKYDAVEKMSDVAKCDMGSQICLMGWVYSTRVQCAGKLIFVDINDGTTTFQIRCVAHRDHEEGKYEGYVGHYVRDDDKIHKILSYEMMTRSEHLSVGCSVKIYGKILLSPEESSQRFEIKIHTLLVIGGLSDPITYPIQKSIVRNTVALRQHHHARFMSPLIQQLMKIRSEALYSIHEYFHDCGVPLIDPNIMTSADCEGAGETFTVSPQFFSPSAIAKIEGRDSMATGADNIVGLTVSSQLPLEAIAKGTGSVYTCQKSFRAEKSDTSKHLAEFLHIEFEKYFITLDWIITFTERMIKHIIRRVLDRCKEQYDFLDDGRVSSGEFQRHREFLGSFLEKDFVRIKHKDAIDVMLKDIKDKIQIPDGKGGMVRLRFKDLPRHGEDLASEHEKYLVQKFGTFVFVTHWPTHIKSFYMYQCDDGTCESFDLLAPIVGEMIGGSMREYRYDVLIREMQRRQMKFETLQWFVDLRRDGSAPHGGWGLGFDRLVMFLTGAQSVRDIVPYPVYYGHCPY